MTGATGFVGSKAARRFLKAGYQLKLLVRDAARLDENLRNRATIITGDISCEQTVAQLVEDTAGVIHCAGVLFASRPEDFLAVNATATATLARAALNAGALPFIHISTLAARQPELSDYAASKKRGEDAIKSVLPEGGWTILRPPAIYGPADRATLPLIKSLSRRFAFLPGNTSQRLSVLHVTDLAAALLTAFRNKTARAGTYELDDGHTGGYSWREIAAIAGRVQDKPVSDIHVPKPVLQFAALAGRAGLARFVPDLGLLSAGKIRELYHPGWACRPERALPGFVADIKFEQGFAQTLRWYRKAGWI